MLSLVRNGTAAAVLVLGLAVTVYAPHSPVVDDHELLEHDSIVPETANSLQVAEVLAMGSIQDVESVCNQLIKPEINAALKSALQSLGEIPLGVTKSGSKQKCATGRHLLTIGLGGIRAVSKPTSNSMRQGAAARTEGKLLVQQRWGGIGKAAKSVGKVAKKGAKTVGKVAKKGAKTVGKVAKRAASGISNAAKAAAGQIKGKLGDAVTGVEDAGKFLGSFLCAGGSYKLQLKSLDGVNNLRLQEFTGFGWKKKQVVDANLLSDASGHLATGAQLTDLFAGVAVFVAPSVSVSGRVSATASVLKIDIPTAESFSAAIPVTVTLRVTGRMKKGRCVLEDIQVSGTGLHVSLGNPTLHLGGIPDSLTGLVTSAFLELAPGLVDTLKKKLTESSIVETTNAKIRTAILDSQSSLLKLC